MLKLKLVIVPTLLLVILIIKMTIWGMSPLSLCLCAIWNNDFKFRHQSGYRIKRLRILPVQSGLWHSLLSAQWPRHSDPPWAAAEHCLVLCWVPLAQVTEQSLQELHSCHCPSTEAPTTTQQACPMWRGREGRQKWEEIFRSLIFFWVKANTKSNKKKIDFGELCCWFSASLQVRN